MPIIGVRELRERTSEILRAIREEQAEFVVAHQGKPVAILLPAPAHVRVSTSSRWRRPQVDRASVVRHRAHYRIEISSKNASSFMTPLGPP